MNIQQAIEEGYEYCMAVGNEGILIHLTDALLEPGEYANNQLLLCEKEPRFHSIDAEDIENLLVEHLDNQEEFYSDESFAEATKGCDDLIKQLAEKMNENLGNRPFYFTTKIYLKY